MCKEGKKIEKLITVGRYVLVSPFLVIRADNTSKIPCVLLYFLGVGAFYAPPTRTRQSHRLPAIRLVLPLFHIILYTYEHHILINLYVEKNASALSRGRVLSSSTTDRCIPNI